jgi:hypothetical protein
MHISYSQGYADALRDVYSWFDNHRHIFQQRPYKARMKDVMLAIVRYFMNNRDRFFMEKECCEFEIFIPNDKKKSVEIKTIEVTK